MVLVHAGWFFLTFFVVMFVIHLVPNCLACFCAVNHMCSINLLRYWRVKGSLA